MKYLKTTLAGCTLAFSPALYADWSSTVTLATDYMFNGVSQTQDDPALQASLDYAADSGWYAGAWTSNVDFGGPTNREVDFYVGKFQQLNKDWTFDYGIAYYTYYGGSISDSFNFPELWAKFGYTSDYGLTEFNGWYSWDYFGFNAEHVVGMVAHTFSLAENHAIRLSVDVSNSFDGDQWTWNVDDTSFVHYRVAYQTSWQGFNFEVAAEDTTLDRSTADQRIVASVSRTFSF